MTFGYRGPHRLLQMSLDILGKIAMTLEHLQHLPQDEADMPICQDRAVLFPNIDRHISLGPNNAGVWFYRDEHQAFQLPLLSQHRGVAITPHGHRHLVDMNRQLKVLFSRRPTNSTA